MSKYVFSKFAKKVSSQAGKEQGSVKSALKGFTGIIADIWDSLIGTLPKMIRLTIELTKSKKVSDKAKLILIGGIFVIGFSVAEEFTSYLTILPLITAIFGPITGFISIFFLKTIKMCLLIVSFYVIAHTCNSIIENEEVEKLSRELFGDQESKEFLKSMQNIYEKLKKYFSPFSNKLCNIFEKIGKKKKSKFDPDVAEDILTRSANKDMKKLLGWSGSLTPNTQILLTDGKEN